MFFSRVIMTMLLTYSIPPTASQRPPLNHPPTPVYLIKTRIKNCSSELGYWRSRLSNLNYIHDQLRSERIRCMAVILEKTSSAYYPCFSRLYKNTLSGERATVFVILSEFLEYLSESRTLAIV